MILLCYDIACGLAQVELLYHHANQWMLSLCHEDLFPPPETSPVLAV